MEISSSSLCSGLERTDFRQCPPLDDVVVLKGLISTNITLGGSGGFERTDLLTFTTLVGCSGLERADFQQFLLGEGVVVLKRLGKTALHVHWWGLLGNRALWVSMTVLLRIWSWKWQLSCDIMGRDCSVAIEIIKDRTVGVSSVVLKGLTADNFQFGMVWCSWNDWCFAGLANGQLS